MALRDMVARVCGQGWSGCRRPLKRRAAARRGAAGAGQGRPMRAAGRGFLSFLALLRADLVLLASTGLQGCTRGLVARLLLLPPVLISRRPHRAPGRLRSRNLHGCALQGCRSAEPRPGAPLKPPGRPRRPCPAPGARLGARSAAESAQPASFAGAPRRAAACPRRLPGAAGAEGALRLRLQPAGCTLSLPPRARAAGAAADGPPPDPALLAAAPARLPALTTALPATCARSCRHPASCTCGQHPAAAATPQHPPQLAARALPDQAARSPARPNVLQQRRPATAAPCGRLPEPARQHGRGGQARRRHGCHVRAAAAAGAAVRPAAVRQPAA